MSEPLHRPLPVRKHLRFVEDVPAWFKNPQSFSTLPSWTRALAEPLPKATASLFKLDYLHRAKNPLGAELSAQLRWHAADAIDCDYARRYAKLDMQRSGMNAAEQEMFTTNNLSDQNRMVSTFARQMTLAAYKVSDQQMDDLIEVFGPEAVVAMVHTLAFANFQNRLFLALGVAVEAQGPLPPIELHVDEDQLSGVLAPERAALQDVSVSNTSSSVQLEWGHKAAGSIEKSLEKQKNRSPRIPLPAIDLFEDLPPANKDHMSKVVWSRVSFGYQPELTGAWFELMQLFREESQLDRVFANSVFWVITRSNECFY